MGIRFRKSITLAPGVRMNFSGSGLSWTLGPRGASVNIGKRGTYLNSSIPGTGFYSRSQLGGRNSRSQVSRQIPKPAVEVSISVGVNDDGTITFKDAIGNPASQTMIDAVKKQKGDSLRDLIQKKCDEINANVEGLGTLHLEMPKPKNVPRYQPEKFGIAPPARPIPKEPGFFAKFFRSKVEKIAEENAQAQAIYEAELRMWEPKKRSLKAPSVTKRHLSHTR